MKILSSLIRIPYSSGLISAQLMLRWWQDWGAYKIESESEFSENIGIIGRQINDAVVSYNYAGAAVYGYGSLFGGSDRGAQEQECIEIAFDKLDTSVK